jgi:hypothetical protein
MNLPFLLFYKNVTTKNLEFDMQFSSFFNWIDRVGRQWPAGSGVGGSPDCDFEVAWSRWLPVPIHSYRTMVTHTGYEHGRALQKGPNEGLGLSTLTNESDKRDPGRKAQAQEPLLPSRGPRLFAAELRPVQTSSVP